MSANNMIRLRLLFKQRTRYAFWRLANIIITGILFGALILATYFIYQNVNMALVNTTVIKDIKSKLTFDSLDIDTYEKIKKIIDNEDGQKPVPTDIRNIFIYGDNKTDKE